MQATPSVHAQSQVTIIIISAIGSRVGTLCHPVIHCTTFITFCPTRYYNIIIIAVEPCGGLGTPLSTSAGRVTCSATRQCPPMYFCHSTDYFSACCPGTCTDIWLGIEAMWPLLGLMRNIIVNSHGISVIGILQSLFSTEFMCTRIPRHLASSTGSAPQVLNVEGSLQARGRG